MRFISNMKVYYQAYEAKKLARLSAFEREDVLAFDALLKKNPVRSYALSALIWVLATLLFKLWLGGKGDWFESAVLALILVVSVAIGLMSAWFGHARHRPSMKLFIIFVGLAVVGGIVGAVIGYSVKHGFSTPTWGAVEGMVGKVLLGGLIAGVIYAAAALAIMQFRRNQLVRRNSELEASAQKERLARQLTDAKLRLLQAQVEPHFLFNTLASVQQLAEDRAPEAAALTSQLITFLRSGLAGFRDETTTLKREFKMVDAYLNIMKTRMDTRLSVELVLPSELESVSLPSAMLISLVENAIKHGLEPHPPGGRITVAASTAGNKLTLRVTDTGRGLILAPSPGLGLCNIRERLHAIYGDAATLTTAHNAPNGFVATLSLPNSNGLPGSQTQ